MSRPKRLRRFGAGRSVHEQGLTEEMAWHLARLVEELEEGGLRPADARAEAERRFGDADAYRRACRSISDRDRALRRWRTGLEGLKFDLQAAVRGLRSAPVYAATVVLTLALAIGMNTAIFSVVDAVVLRPLDLPAPERLLMIRQLERDTGDFDSVTPANFVDWRAQSTSFDGMAAIENRAPTLAGDREPERLRAAAVTEDFFALIGQAPTIGRVFDREEHGSVDARVVVLSDRLFRSRFGGDRAILDDTIELDGETVQVVGVMPPSFDVPLETDLWVPLVFDFDVADARGAHYLSVLGRLTEGVARETAFAELDAIARRLEAEYPRTNTNSGIGLVPLQEQQAGSVRPVLLILVAAVALVLLIACANIAGLALARAVGREREMALRTALGAGRGRLARQLLGEAVLLAFLGGAGGLLLAWLTIALLVERLPFDLPRMEQVGVDGRTLLFTWLVTLVCTVLFGLAPTLRLTRVPLEKTLRDHSAVVLGTGRKLWVRQSLVAVEMALALVLLSACGLLIRSLTALDNVDLGFDSAGILTFELDLPETRYPDHQPVVFYEQMLSELRAVPGVQSAAIAPWLPLTPGWMFSFQIVGAPPAPPEARQGANLRMISSDYFETLGIERIGGRTFDRRDFAEGPAVIVVNRALADRYFEDRDPLGQSLELGYSRDDGPPIQRRIVGVVGNVRHFGPAGPALPTVYAPHAQLPFDDMAFAIRAEGNPMDLVPAVRRIAGELDSSIAVDRIQTLEARYGERLAIRRFVPAVLGLFSVLALLLAALGLYGVLAQLVSVRTAEFGIRRALGASASSVIRLVVVRAMVIVAIGVAGGLAGAWASSRLFESLLFGVEASDPATLFTVSVVLAVVALGACILPAMRANRVDPVRALRQT